MKWLVDLWRAMTPEAQRFLSWGSACLALLFIAGLGAAKLWPEWRVALREEPDPSAITVTPFEYYQFQEDKRHAGEIPHRLDIKEGIVVIHYDKSDCILLQRSGGERLWSTGAAHRTSPPPLPESLNAVLGAGLVFSGDTAGACIYPPFDHWGEWLWDRTLPKEDRCWIFRVGFFWQDGVTDGCELAVPYDECTYQWRYDLAKWITGTCQH